MFDKKILPACLVSVVVPVRDESLYLEKSLTALAAQIDFSGKTLENSRYEILVLTNNCSDNSFRIARRFQFENESVNLHIADLNTSRNDANSGFVRRLLMQTAYERLLGNDRNGGVILTTDGDSQVANNWIAANISEIKNGADAVGGRILFDPGEFAKMNSAAKRIYLIDEKYRLLSAELESHLDFLPHDAFPKHHQHFNGSFAVTTAAYRKSGGVPAVRCLEDVAFYNSLMRIDAKFRHSPTVKVYTSTRETGRTEAGLSTQIRDWINLHENGENFLVESADVLENRFEFHGRLRSLREIINNGCRPQNFEIEALAKFFDLPFEGLKFELFKPQSFGLLLENIYKIKSESEIVSDIIPLVPVEKAVADLEQKLAKFRQSKTVSFAVA